jgi:hypothetical protein
MFVFCSTIVIIIFIRIQEKEPSSQGNVLKLTHLNILLGGFQANYNLTAMYNKYILYEN